MRASLVGFLVLSLIAMVACSSGPDSPGGGNGGGNGGGGSGGSGGASGSGGSAGGSGGSGGSGTVTLPVGDCYTFATQAAQPYTASCGDLMTLTGARVDLSNGTGSSQLCLLGGSYTSLAEVPSSYASCAWTGYIEGGDDLANHGIMVLDSTGTHHYRVWIESNAQPSLVFSFAPID